MDANLKIAKELDCDVLVVGAGNAGMQAAAEYSQENSAPTPRNRLQTVPENATPNQAPSRPAPQPSQPQSPPVRYYPSDDDDDWDDDDWDDYWDDDDWDDD
ncbi:hypothetical protein QP168_06030 [Aerococcus urinae]|uniref:FAD-dependent oxidoreductase 2 FAD binding domain-containing protein n=1 Tax=Aerococcus mictus TaxID=2976810 RepID=A0A1E9P961_9LACT|nr:MULTISPECIES: hypothetical protein [Aerococcus]KAA9291517.1 hypothetical protein F6I06_05400 [Aerococcus mictus]MBU5610206.1 hypothetical protein [Aerococcus urinae]MCY3034817.1 hypothetical protein [Aerococcus mictus]MCY3064151.1 hypothetical protein [Aerococcus mictus]MCY3064826.1 hypothetical protein [Aerococcus mictus]